MSDEPSGRQALAGLRVLDLSWGIAGPLGVLLLAEHGADTIKVEPPGGDPFRRSEGYRCWNRSRRSVELDVTSDEGRAQFRRLATTTDVMVETFRPGVLDRLGLGYTALAADNAGLIMVSCPAYPPGHRRADRPGFDALVQASSGQMWEQPGWRSGPIFLPMPMPSMAACYLVAAGALGALSARERTGTGQHVETSLYQGALLYTTQIWQDVERSDAPYHELMGKTYPPGIHQGTIFECADGEWLHLSLLSGLTPLRSVDEILAGETAGGERTGPGPVESFLSPAEREAIAERRRSKFLTWKRDEVIDALRGQNHAVEAVVPAGAGLLHPQTAANGTAVTIVDPEVGPTTQMGVPIHLLGTPGRVVGPQPPPGQHTAEVLASLAEPRLRPTVQPSPEPPESPLAGVRLLDFGQFLAGPFGPMILGDLGADVIKIEPPRGDNMRQSGKPFVGCQRGKRSLAIDLKTPAGLEAAHRLIATADVVHHNMTRGVAERLQIDYPACRDLRADIIYCNTYAYGLPDPLGHFGGLDPLYQASSGLEYEGGACHAGGRPLYLRFGMTDTSNAMLSAIGVLLALVHRQRTGEGQELWTSLHDGALLFTSDVWLRPDGTPWAAPRLDAGQHGTGALYRLYPTKADGWICIAAAAQEHWEALTSVLGLEAVLSDERFATADARRAHREELEAVLGPVFLSRTAGEWTRRLDDLGVPNEIPVDTHEGSLALHDADNVRLGLVTEYEHPVLGRLRQFGEVIGFSETPARIAGPPPLVGQHTQEILSDLGYRDGDIAAMIGSGAAYAPDDRYGERFSN